MSLKCLQHNVDMISNGKDWDCPVCHPEIVPQITALRAELAAMTAERDKWKQCVPDKCPITNLPFHDAFKEPDGEYRPFYGGPIISYGLPYIDTDGYLSRERLDEDDMTIENETTCLLVMEEAKFGDIQERLAEFKTALEDAYSALSLMHCRKDDALVHGALCKVGSVLQATEGATE